MTAAQEPEPTLRSWTMDEYITLLTEEHVITTPYTREERDLARKIAVAYYFVEWEGELPERACEHQSPEHLSLELMAFDAALVRMQHRRGETYKAIHRFAGKDVTVD